MATRLIRRQGNGNNRRRSRRRLRAQIRDNRRHHRGARAEDGGERPDGGRGRAPVRLEGDTLRVPDAVGRGAVGMWLA